MGNDPSKQKQDQHTQKNSQANSQNNNGNSISSSPSLKDDPYKIVTVTTYQKPTDDDTENVLQYFPYFTPLIPTSADPKWSWKMLKSPPVTVDPKAILTVCSQAQEFFHDSGTEIAQNQQLLGLKVSRSQDKIVEAHSAAFQHAQDVKNFDIYLREIHRVNQMVESINHNLQSVLETMQQIYDLLPSDEKDSLEPPQSLLEQNSNISISATQFAPTLKFDPNQALQQFLKSAASIENILNSNKEKKDQTNSDQKANPT